MAERSIYLCFAQRGRCRGAMYLERQWLVTRRRSTRDERELIVGITEKGMALRNLALAVPAQMASCTSLSLEEAVQLKILLAKVLGTDSR